MTDEVEASLEDTATEAFIIVIIGILGFLAYAVYRVQADMLERERQEKRRQLLENMKIKARDDWTLEGEHQGIIGK